MTEFYGVLQRSIFVLNSRLMFSDIKSDIGTSTGYMTEKNGASQNDRDIHRNGRRTELLYSCSHFYHFEQINSLII